MNLVLSQITDGFTSVYGGCVLYVIACFSSFEIARVISTVLTVVFTLVTSTKSLIDTIFMSTSLQRSIVLFRKLLLLTQFGKEGFREVAGVLMCFGFVVVVSINFMVLTCYQEMPLGIYIIDWLILVVICTSFSFVLPKIIDCNDYSRQFLKYDLIYDCQARCATTADRRYSLKVIRATMPLTYYYGVAKFDQETKTNFYWQILDFTINFVLME